ncbi:hypothetical protein ALT721_1550041 [Alteromonas alvinellae]
MFYTNLSINLFYTIFDISFIYSLFCTRTVMKVNTPKDLSAVIRDCRKLKGWTQAELAERIGVYQKDVSNCETKPEKISVEMLIKLCAALNLEFSVGKLPSVDVSAPATAITKKSLRF